MLVRAKAEAERGAQIVVTFVSSAPTATRTRPRTRACSESPLSAPRVPRPARLAPRPALTLLVLLTAGCTSCRRSFATSYKLVLLPSVVFWHKKTAYRNVKWSNFIIRS